VTVEFACSAVLFDLDGVLVFSAASVRRSWIAWAAAHGLDEREVLAASKGWRSVDTIRHVAPGLNAVAEAAQLEAEQALDVADVTAGPGSSGLLDQLADGEWAVVTSGSEPLSRARLRAAGLPAPGVLVTAERVSHGKPDPGGYLLAARLLCRAPEGCLVIEDSLAGVRSGKRAGMRVLGLTNGSDAGHLAEADAVVESCMDIRVTRPAFQHSESTLLVRAPWVGGL
jgi:sugar-phosphatase